VYYDLFEKIPKGSILLWNVEDEKALPKRKEMIRLLGTEDFVYYKTHGHHRDYIRSLARLKDCLSPNTSEDQRGYWSQIPTSHFLFTAQEIESNTFFLLKFSTQCLGSYFVDGSDLSNLEKLLRTYDQVRRIADEVKGWVNRIEGHKEDIKQDGIEDVVIENFQIQRLTALTNGYGQQAINHAMSKLEDWHDQHYWKSKKPKNQVDVPQDDVVTT
jgi:hypothetical protein